MRVDEQIADKRRERQTSGQLTAKSISINGAKRKSADCALKAIEASLGEVLLWVPDAGLRGAGFPARALNTALSNAHFDSLGLPRLANGR